MSEQTFGQRLQRLLDERGITKYRLGKDSGVSENLIGKIVRGERSATDEVLARLSPVLDVPFAQLKAWRAASEMGPEEIQYLLKDAGPVLRIEAAALEIDRLTAELEQLIEAPKTPEVLKRGDEIEALLVALENLIEEEGAKLEAEKKRRAER